LSNRPCDATMPAMRVPRFFVADLSPDAIPVAGQEAVHALRVLRLAAGDRIDLFDGRGDTAAAVVREVHAGGFTAAVVSRATAATPSAGRLTLAVAAPKGPRADWLIEKCAELGVAVLRPVLFERSVVEPGEGKIDRWRRKAVEAAKQCGAAATMDITDPTELAALLRDATLPPNRWFGHPAPDAPRFADCLNDPGNSPAPTDALFVIGPEGGLTPAEIDRLTRADIRPVRIADTVLRIETAAIAIASIWAGLNCRRPTSSPT